MNKPYFEDDNQKEHYKILSQGFFQNASMED
jgi:hypothetical protein